MLWRLFILFSVHNGTGHGNVSFQCSSVGPEFRVNLVSVCVATFYRPSHNSYLFCRKIYKASVK